MQRRAFIGLLGGAAASPFALAARKDGLGEEPCARSVLFCSVSQQWLCCSPTLTPSAGRARKGARRRGPAEAGARSTLGTAPRTAAIRRSINAGRRQGRKAAGAAPIHFRPCHTGPATPGQVRSARAAAGYRLFLPAAARAASPFALLFLVTITRGDLTSPGPLPKGVGPGVALASRIPLHRLSTLFGREAGKSVESSRPPK